jgi:hypothetical protein
MKSFDHEKVDFNNFSRKKRFFTTFSSKAKKIS